MAWKKSFQFLLKAAGLVGLGGFLFGYDIGVISGALLQLKHHFNLTNYQCGLVVSFLPLGSIVGCVFGGPLCDKIGRWWTIHLQNFLFILGALIVSTATTINLLYIGRFIIGIASALSAVADIPYLTEISPLSYRGMISSAYEILVVVGILISFIIALCLVHHDSGWRIMFIFPVIFSFIQSLGLLFLPESPQWLIEKNQIERAKGVLELIVDTQEEVNSRFDELTSHCSAKLSGITLSSRIHFRQYLVPIIVIVVLMIFQQFTGGVVVRNYAPKIFLIAGYGDVASLKFTVILGVVKVVITGWAIWNVDTLGRKPLLLYGISLIGLGMLILSISFGIGVHGNGDNGWSPQSSLHSLLIMLVFIIACSLITAGYSIGFGPVSWLLQSELFPTVIRGRTMALSVFISNCAQFLSNLIFLPLVHSIGDSLTFFYFFAICCLGFLFIFFFLVETKEQQPDEILHNYQILIQKYSILLEPCFCRQKSNNQRENIRFLTVSNVLHDADGEEMGKKEAFDFNEGQQVELSGGKTNTGAL